jgi:1-acyl-sn-glycerol-3-phosphate acyltransferase
MILKQIIYLSSFVLWVLSYSYLLITPSILLSNNFILKHAKILSQSFSTMMLLDGFKMDFFMADTEKNVEQLISQNPELIDVIVCNHVSTVDFLIIMAYLQKFKIGSFNFVLKNEIVYTPGFGLIMYGSPDIKLNRNWEKDKETFGKQIDKIQTNSGEKQIILIFPEGTRLTKKKLEEGQQFSIDNNLPVFKNLLVPKTKGLWHLINHLDQTKRLGRVWDITLAIPKFLGKSAYLSDIVSKPIGPVYGIFRELELPKNEYQDLDKFKNWFLKNWKLKDDFLQNYTKFIYRRVKYEDLKYKHIAITTLVIILGLMLVSNKYGRYYLLISLVLSYILILFKL